MTRAAIYNRCSTDMEAQVSALETQVAESKEIVSGMGWKLVKQYVESESATTRNRPLYQQLLCDISEHRFDVLVVKSIDRINRNVRDFYFLLDCLTQNQVKLYLYLERKYYEAGDSLITGIKAILAEDFSRELSRKIRNAHARRQKLQSGLNISREMFGWNKTGKNQFELNKEESEYYRQAFDLAREGYGFRKIAKIMYERGARTRHGKELTEVHWRNMLRSPRAHGEVILHRDNYNFETKKREKLPPEDWIHIKDALPAIVSEEAHKEILQILDNRAEETNEQNQFKRGTKERGSGLFSNKLICACCGKHYYRITDTSAMGKMSVWKCASYINYGKKTYNSAGCNNIMVRESILKTLIGEKCQELFDAFFVEDDNLVEETLEVLQRAFTLEDVGNKRKSLLAGREKLLQRKERLMEKLMDGIITDADFKKTNRILKQEINEIEKELSQIQVRQENYRSCESRLLEIKEKILQEKMIEDAKANYIFEKIDRMRVFPDGRIQIYFNRKSLLGIMEIHPESYILAVDSADGDTAGEDAANGDAVNGYTADGDAVNGDAADDMMFEVWYRHITLSEERRQKHRELIYHAMKENPYITIPGLAEQLQFTQSYVSLRIKELKSEEKIYYDRKKGEKCWKII